MFSTTPDGENTGLTGSTLFVSTLFDEPWDLTKYPSYTAPVSIFKHTAVVYDKGLIIIYINGVLESVANILHGGSLDNPYDILVGTYLFNNGTVVVAAETHHTFQGFIDELRIHNRALPECEIQSLYKSTDECVNEARFTQADIDAAYQRGFDDGVATYPPATLSPTFKLHIPLLHYTPLATEDAAKMSLWVDMEMTDYDNLQLQVTNYGIIK